MKIFNVKSCFSVSSTSPVYHQVLPLITKPHYLLLLNLLLLNQYLLTYDKTKKSYLAYHKSSYANFMTIKNNKRDMKF